MHWNEMTNQEKILHVVKTLAIHMKLATQFRLLAHTDKGNECIEKRNYVSMFRTRTCVFVLLRGSETQTS